METKEDFKQYKDAVVSFIDILGFKSMLDKSTANEIHNIYELFKFQLKTNSRSNFESRSNLKLETDIHFFSDCVVRIKYANDNDTAFLVETDEILSLASMQNSLLKKDILIRGGVVRGPIYSDPKNNILFGPALVEAYKLESECAKTPRIIISDEVYRNYVGDMFSDPHYLKQNGRANRPALNFDKNIPQDEFWFINYFWGPVANRFHQLVKDKRIEDIISSYLSIHNKYKSKEQNDSYSKSTLEKFSWCRRNIHETIKDLYEWIEGFEYSTNIDKELLKALKKETESFLNTQIKEKPNNR